MQEISSLTVCKSTIEQLGLNSNKLDILSEETLSNLLRRVASFRCPCSGRILVNTVSDAIECFIEDDSLKDKLENVLEALISYGDLLEANNITILSDDVKSTWLYTAPPAFVDRLNGHLIIIGIANENILPLPGHIKNRIEYNKHRRYINPESDEYLTATLREHGFIELSEQMWLQSPRKTTAQDLLKKMKLGLDDSQYPGELTGLVILDPRRPVHFYKGRWTEPKRQTGYFVARRTQAYGSDLWCFVKLDDGISTKLVDFPLQNSTYRGCDEAWYLQMAIDACNDNPQTFRIRSSPDQNRKIIDFFSPVPMWARKRFDYFGDPIEKHQCLFSYSFENEELLHQLKFIKDELWLLEARGH